MLKLCTYQVLRLFSHSGTCWTRARSATSGAGRSRIAGIRKTFVVWKPWLRGVWTVKSWATAAHEENTANAAHSSAEASRCARSGAATAVASAMTTPQKSVARGVRSRTGSFEPRADIAPLPVTALIASPSFAPPSALAADGSHALHRGHHPFVYDRLGSGKPSPGDMAQGIVPGGGTR